MDAAQQDRSKAEKSLSIPSTVSPLHVVAAALAFLLLFYVLWQLPYFVDWDTVYHPVGRAVASPYTVPGFFNAPWLAWILAPFALLPIHLSGAIWVALSTLAGLWCIHHLEGGLFATVLCLLSPAYIRFATSGQIDAVPLLGFVLLLTARSLRRESLGVVLMLVKPQVFGAGLLTYWLNLEHRQKFWVLAAPVAVVSVSFVLYGFWPLQMGWQHLSQSPNIAPWPYGIPVGLGLLAWSVRAQKPALGGLSTIFLVPYIATSSVFAYTVVLFSLAPRWLSVGAFLFLWIMALTIM